MAILDSSFTQDFANVKPEDITPVPEGEYILQVTKTELSPTKDGSGKYVKVQFDIIGPSYQGRKIFANFNIHNNSTIAENIGKQQLKALVLAGHVQEPLRDTDQLLGATVKASVTIRPASGQYGPQNEAKNFKPASDAMPGAPMGMPPMPSAAPVGDAVTPPQGGGFSQAFAQPPQTPAPQTAPDAAAGAPKWW